MINNLNQKRKTAKKILKGIVIKKSSQKTISVLVETKKMNKKYHVYYKKHKKYLVHDKDDLAKINNNVLIIKTRKFSKHKSFSLLEIVS